MEARTGPRKLVLSISGPDPEPGQNRLQEARFENFWPQAKNLARTGPRRLVFRISGPRHRTWPEQAPGGSFGKFLAPGPEPGENRPREVDFEHFWLQA